MHKLQHELPNAFGKVIMIITITVVIISITTFFISITITLKIFKNDNNNSNNNDNNNNSTSNDKTRIAWYQAYMLLFLSSTYLFSKMFFHLVLVKMIEKYQTQYFHCHLILFSNDNMTQQNKSECS